ncbi:RING/U-box superfamily protein with ARM repeat domain-containing protein [Actinidia rufa]|uniref:RING-type E3 ubiquitin transferase n=1 Tax=Actinidia rufa TaxID=165716 RepID=A0A7J0GAE7_9ERIC|nr:RING/U-box superfamily protein with ARM repeat domain-containing protein [Actinidia rufa]
MGGNGKHRWKISIYRSSSSKKLEKKEPPTEFICPISGSLMSDPVVVSSGQTFERTSVQVCRALGFSPPLPDGSIPDFTVVIPNSALKSTILKWCDASGADQPTAPDYGSVEDIVRTVVGDGAPKIRVSERELLRGVTEKPEVLFFHAATELNHRVNHFDSASSEESVIANVPTTPLFPFATRPMCYSEESSSSIASDEGINPNFSSEDEEFVTTRSNEEARVSLCTSRLLSSLRPLLISRYAVVQTNAVAAVVNLSLEKANKVKIVRSGIAPPLIDVLKGGAAESQEHAAGAIFSLALEDDNKTAMGVLGALQPLLHALRSESDRTRHDAAMALYHLSLVQSNRVKLVKLDAVSTLLSLLRGGELAGRVMLVLCNLASCAEGRSALLDNNAVEILVGMLRRGSESTRENCVAALDSLSHGSLRFKGLARAAGAAEVLRDVEERGSERAREKARKMMLLLRGRDEAAASATEEVLEVGLSRSRHRDGRNSFGPNSTEF